MDESELCPALFGISSDEINNYYLEHFTSQRQRQLWPYFSILLDDSRAVEVEYADSSEYQTRYKIADAAGPITLGYDSGHFSLPAFRWPEVLAIANVCRVPLRRYQLILLLFPGIYVGTADETDAVRQLTECFTQLGLFNAGARDKLATNAVKNRRVDCPWVYEEPFGWTCKGEYAQRNPSSLLSQLREGDFLRIKAFFDSLSENLTKGLEP
jgi:hypothetical protein